VRSGIGKKAWPNTRIGFCSGVPTLCRAFEMTKAAVAIVVCGLTEKWLGGVNYYRNLVSVFDDAGDNGMRLHVLTDDAAYFDDLRLSERVQVHSLAMLKGRSAAWALRKALLTTFKRDVMLIAHMQRLGVTAAVFCHVPGASAAGIRCLPWIPDFQSRHHPELSQPSMIEAEHQRAQVWLRDSDGLIVSSQAARDDAVTFYGADPQRLRVLHFAPRMAASELSQLALRDEVWARHGIDRPYFFLPNQYWKHKNHGLVLQAMQGLRDQGLPVPLVVSTGKTEDMRDAGYFAEFAAKLQALGLQKDYRVLGVVPRQDMLVLLAHCAVVLNPSCFEGWSTSVEEAKALGKPLLVSDIPVHREQVAGLSDVGLFGTADAAALAALMQQHQARATWAGPHSPQPQPALYEAFMHQYIGLLKSLTLPTGVVA
jgi:glycosyltransferase involved in cell wall biosynthesis